MQRVDWDVMRQVIYNTLIKDGHQHYASGLSHKLIGQIQVNFEDDLTTRKISEPCCEFNQGDPPGMLFAGRVLRMCNLCAGGAIARIKTAEIGRIEHERVEKSYANDNLRLRREVENLTKQIKGINEILHPGNPIEDEDR